jgi:hypothetical protein
MAASAFARVAALTLVATWNCTVRFGYVGRAAAAARRNWRSHYQQQTYTNIAMISRSILASSVDRLDGRRADRAAPTSAPLSSAGAIANRCASRTSASSRRASGQPLPVPARAGYHLAIVETSLEEDLEAAAAAMTWSPRGPRERRMSTRFRSRSSGPFATADFRTERSRGAINGSPRRSSATRLRR